MEGGSLLEAARFYAKQHPHSLPRKLVADVMDELLKAYAKQRNDRGQSSPNVACHAPSLLPSFTWHFAQPKSVGPELIEQNGNSVNRSRRRAISTPGALRTCVRGN